jgi:predicted metal-dependent hydrolase
MPPYTLNPHNSRTKHIRITLTHDGHIKVSKPRHVTIAQVKAFILSKSDWINHHLNKIKSTQSEESQNSNQQPLKKLTRRDYLLHKTTALQLAKTKLAIYNKHYNLTYKNISIKNTKTRWGSCSRRGNLNFNYKIALIPEHLADYIIVHELCHLEQFNHSQKFWDLVAETIPDYKKRVRELKGVCI